MGICGCNCSATTTTRAIIKIATNVLHTCRRQCQLWVNCLGRGYAPVAYVLPFPQHAVSFYALCFSSLSPLSRYLSLLTSTALSFSLCFLYKCFYCCCCCCCADILTCEVRHTRTRTHKHTLTLWHTDRRACIMAAVKTAANCFFYSSQICIKRKTCVRLSV